MLDRKALYYATREALNEELDMRHDGLIRWAIRYFEGNKFPAGHEMCDAELMALAQAARRREGEA
jgi:hypothetical protein